MKIILQSALALGISFVSFYLIFVLIIPAIYRKTNRKIIRPCIAKVKHFCSYWYHYTRAKYQLYYNRRHRSNVGVATTHYRSANTNETDTSFEMNDYGVFLPKEEDVVYEGKVEDIEECKENNSDYHEFTETTNLNQV